MKSVQPTSLSVNGPQRSRVLVPGHDTRDTATYSANVVGVSKAKLKSCKEGISCCCSCLTEVCYQCVPTMKELKLNGTVSLLLLH